MKYFAYGTNMDRERMKNRCSSAKVISWAEISNYKFILNSRGVATIVPVKDSKVYGVVYEIDQKCLESLNIHEGVPDLYTREKVKVVDNHKNKVEAIVYIATDSVEGQNLRGHLEIILKGAEDNKLPTGYIQELKNKYC